MGDSKDDWEFKVENTDKGPKSSKDLASIEIGQGRQKKKKKKTAPRSHVAKKPVELGLDQTAVPSRRSRAALAREQERQDRLEKIKEADISLRVKAFVFDLVVLAAFAVAAYFAREEVYKYYIQGLTQLGMNQDLAPEILNRLLFSIVFIPLYFVFHFLPTVFSRKSWGMKKFKLRIGGGDMIEDAGFAQMILRELMALVSMGSVVGVLLVLANKRHRALHDFLSGTCVYRDF